MLEPFRLKIAIQKSGRLSRRSQILFKQCGIRINLQKSRLLSYAENMPIDVVRVRDDDIPDLITDRIVDLGIVGRNVFEEKILSRRLQKKDIRHRILRKLDFGKCRLSVALPLNQSWEEFKKIQNKKITTSYPLLLKKYLKEFDIVFTPCLLNGSVEVAPKVGLSDAVCDLVSTGSTLEENGLYEAKILYRSCACLIQRGGKMHPEKESLVKTLLLRIRGIIRAKESKYIMMHIPQDKIENAIRLLPGIEQPTVLPLSEHSKKLVLHVVGSESTFWETIEKLKRLGASSILVLPIEKMIE